MTIEKLQKEMIACMKEHNKEKKDAVSALLTAAKKVAIDAGVRDNAPEDMVDTAILKEIKSVKEQVDTCPADREDLKAAYEQRLNFMMEYAPKQMSAEEVKALLNANFAEVIATKNKGAIMKAVMPSLKGKADGQMINAIITELCK